MNLFNIYMIYVQPVSHLTMRRNTLEHKKDFNHYCCSSTCFHKHSIRFNTFIFSLPRETLDCLIGRTHKRSVGLRASPFQRSHCDFVIVPLQYFFYYLLTCCKLYKS